MSEHILVDETLISRLPLPLAQLARRVPNAKTPLERHLAAYLLWEAGLKLLASAAIVEYAERRDPDPALAERLKNLARPSVGHWWEFVRRLVPVLAEGGDDGFREVRDLVLGRTRDDLPRAAGLDAALLGAEGGPAAARSTVRLTELFERMVSYRNREIGHGAAGQRASSFYDRMARALMAGLSQVFDRLDVLAGRQLIYVDDVRRLASGDWLVDRYELIGEAAKRIESMTVADAQSATLPRPHRVYLEGRAGGLFTSRSLHPLICYQLDTGKVFFLNGRRGKQQAEYLCYDDGDLLRMDLNADHRSLLAEVLGRPVDSELADAWAAESTAEDAPEELHPARMPERAVGEFELLSRLGRGGMGVVYRAWQPSLCRQVAVKCMLRSGDPKAEARFAREIRALGRVEHPNLVKVFTSGSEGDQWFYAMELVEGAELSGICEQLAGRDASAVDESSWREALSSAYAKARSSETPLSQLGRGAPSPPDDDIPHPESSGAAEVHLPAPGGRGYVHHVVGLLERIADAAHTLHEAGVVHRDIKPGNVMITADGQTPVLMDLGLAQIADETEGRITHTRQFIGTLRYASPEQILAAGSVDRRSDVYSLGATLWELLTLRPLFGATDQTPSPDLMLDIQSRTPESLRRYNPQVPRDLEACVFKCLEKDRTRRYTTAADLAADLNRFLRGEPVAAQPPSLGYLTSKFVKRHKLPLAAAAAVLLTLITGTGFAFYRINKERKDALSARNNEAAAKVEAQDRAREASALAGKNSALAEQEAEARRNVVRQLGLARLTAFDMQLDRAGKLLQTDPAAAARMLADKDQCPPDLRDFAWGHLMARARRVKWVIRPDASPIHRVAFLPDAFVFATAGADGTVRLWNGAGSSHQAMTAFSGHDGDVWSVTIAPDARTAASAGRDGTIRVWDLVKGVAGAVLRGHEGDVNDVAFSPGGKALASGGRDGTVRVWDVGQGVPIVTLRSGGEPIFGIAFSPDGGTLASSGADGVVRIWDASRIVPDPPAPKKQPVEAHGFGLRPQALPVVHDWNLKDAHERLTIMVDGGPALALAFAPDGLMLAGGCVDRVVRVWESIKGHEEARLTGHGGPVTALAFSPDGVTFASCGAAGIKLWDTESWRETSVLRDSGAESPTALAFSVDSGMLAVGDHSGMLSVWDVPDRRMRRWFSGHKKTLQPAVYSPDGTVLASSQSDGKIRFWDAATGAPLRSFAGHTRFVSEVTFSPDGKTLASASDDGTAKTWDMETGREQAVMTLAGSAADGASRAFTVAYAPDGKTLAVAGTDGQIHLFDVATGRERLAFPKEPPEIATPKPPAREPASPKPAPVPARADRKLPADDPAAALAAAVAVEADKTYRAQMTEQVLKRIRESRDSRDGALSILRSAQTMVRSAEQLDEATRYRLDGEIHSELVKARQLRVIRSLAYAPDGRTLVSADVRGLIRVWNSATGEEVVAVGSQPEGVDRVAYSPDGRFIASTGYDADLVLWDPSGIGERLRLAGRSGVTPSFSFAPDGQALAYQTVDAVRVIHIETRQNLAMFTDIGLVRGLAFAPDGKTLVGNDSDNLWAWDLAPTPEQAALFGHRTEVCSVAVSIDGRIASGDKYGRILLWNPSGCLAAELTGESDPRLNDFTMDEVDSLSFSPSGRLVASRTDKGLITVWDVITGRARARLGRFPDAPPGKEQPSYFGRPARNTLAFSPDGQLFAATSGAGKVSVWDTRTWRESNLDGPSELPLALSFGVDARTIVAVYDSGAISRWDLKTHKHIKIQSVGPVAVAALSPDGKTLAVGRRPVEEIIAAPEPPPGRPKATAPTISMRDTATGRVVAELKGIPENVLSLSFSADSRRIAAAGSSGGVTVWDATSGEKTLAVSIAPLTGNVSSVAFAQDGSTIATAGPQSAVYLWDAATGQQRGSLEGHTAAATALALAPDGATLATAGQDWMARLWDVSTGAHIATLASHNASVLAVAFSRDGKSLATCGDDGKILFWDAATGQVRGSVGNKVGEAKPKAVAYSSDGITFAIATEDAVVHLWNTSTGAAVKELKGSERIHALVFSPDGRTLYAAETHGAVRVWSIASGEPVAGPTWPNTTPRALALDPSGRTLAVAFTDATVRLWDVVGREDRHTLRGHSGAVLGLAFSPDGKTLATAAADRTVRLWDAEAGQLRGTLEGHSGDVVGVAFSADGQTLASAGADRVVKLWRGLTGLNPSASLVHADRVSAVAWAPDGRTVASAGQDGTVLLWDATTGQRRASIVAHGEGVADLAFSPDGRTVATAGEWVVKLWDTATGKQRGALGRHMGRVEAVAFSPDGKTLASAGDDRTVRLWDASDLRGLTALTGHTGKIMDLAFSPDGRELAAAGESGEIKLWNVASGRERVALVGHTGRLEAVAFSPDGKTLASAAADRTVRLWDPATGRERAVLRPHAATVTSLAFGRDGNALATCGSDGSVKLWNVATGSELVKIAGHTDQVNGLAFSPDGNSLASAGSDKVVHFWEVARAKAHATENPLVRSLFNPSHRHFRDGLAQRTRDTRLILEKLEEPISMSFNEETPLDDILKYIKQATTTPSYPGIPIHVDPVGLQEAEKTMNSTVKSFDIEGSPLKKTFPLLLSQLDLTFRVADGLLTITSQEIGDETFGATLDTPRQAVNLDSPKVRELLEKLEQPIAMPFGEETPLEDVLKYIKVATITPSYSGIPIYVDPLGLAEADKTLTSVIKYDAEGVPLRQTLREILSQLDLKYVVGDEFVTITSRWSTSSPGTTLRVRKLARTLELPVEFSFAEPTSLDIVLEAITAATTGPADEGLEIMVLGQDPTKPPGLEPARKVVYRSKGKPLRESLKEMLAPLGLVYEVDDGFLFILPKDQAGKARELWRKEGFPGGLQ